MILCREKKQAATLMYSSRTHIILHRSFTATFLYRVSTSLYIVVVDSRQHHRTTAPPKQDAAGCVEALAARVRIKLAGKKTPTVMLYIETLERTTNGIMR